MYRICVHACMHITNASQASEKMDVATIIIKRILPFFQQYICYNKLWISARIRDRILACSLQPRGWQQVPQTAAQKGCKHVEIIWLNRQVYQAKNQTNIDANYLRKVLNLSSLRLSPKQCPLFWGCRWRTGNPCRPFGVLFILFIFFIFFQPCVH